jgi:hypothetical protein
VALVELQVLYLKFTEVTEEKPQISVRILDIPVAIRKQKLPDTS